MADKPSSTDYFPDDPIITETEDLFDRKSFVDGLYHRIICYPFSSSFVYGLFGKWGEGKTSILNLLTSRLIQNEEVIVFTFDPWNFSSEEAVIKSFYEGLHRALNQKFFLPNLKGMLKRYQSILLPGMEKYGIKFSLLTTEESIDDLKSRIEDLILITGKKIVIIVDDLDRLQNKAEIHQVLKLIKLTARFRKTLFVLSFDPEIIENHFFKESSDSGFLEKIIQEPIQIPAADQSQIDKYLYRSYPSENHFSGIDRLLQKCQISHERMVIFEGDFSYYYNTYIRSLFTTLRNAKRFLNRIYQSLPPIKNEINLFDFIVLELIAILYPKIYNDIWKNPWYYLPAWGEKSFASPFIFGLDENERYQKTKEHINSVFAGQEKRELVQQLIEKLFFEVGNAFSPNHGARTSISEDLTRQEKRLTHPDIFPKYFMLKTPSSDLPDETIESLISTWNDLNPDILEYKITEDLKAFHTVGKAMKALEKIMVFKSIIKPHSGKTLIQAIFKNIDAYSQKGRLEAWQSEYDKAIGLMLRLINDIIEDSQIQPVLLQMVRDTSSHDLAAIIILSCKREKGGSLYRIYKNVEFDTLHGAFSDKLGRHYIEGKRDLLMEEPKLFGFILNQWISYNLDYKEPVNNYIFSLINNHPEYIERLIKIFFLGGHIDEQNFQYSDLIRLLDENKLYFLVKNIKDNPFQGPNGKSAIDVFIKTYETPIRSTQRLANSANFNNAITKGYTFFSNKQFIDSLREFESALRITDWNDEYHSIDQARLMKWKCLLELGLNEAGSDPVEKYFREASKIADNLARINTLIEQAFRDRDFDKAPFQVYCCIYYFLKWVFAEKEQKSEIKDNFKMHYAIATSRNTSGHSEEISKRCEELLGRMN